MKRTIVLCLCLILAPVGLYATMLFGVFRSPTFYGVDWDESADAYARTGTLAGVATGSSPGNASLPIQALMRRCVLADNGTVAYYLKADDSTKKADGSAANLDGTDGQVMVQIPKFYYKYSYAGTTHSWQISATPSAGFAVHPAFVKDGTEVNYRYIGAYEAVLYDVSDSRYVNGIYQTAASCTFASEGKTITANARTHPFTLLSAGDKITISGTTSNNSTFTVVSSTDTVITVSEALTDETAALTVVQTQKNWTAGTGDKLSSVSGRSPIVYGYRSQFRAAAANRGTGWRQLDYDLISAIQLLYLVEYASFRSQSVIGAGLTDWQVSTWTNWNDSNPINATGLSNSAGNTTANATRGNGTTGSYMSYRGIENWYGHLWKWADGININANVPYLSNDSTVWADNTATGYTETGLTLPASNGWQITLHQYGRALLPASVDSSSSTTKITDYYYQSTGSCVVFVGGSAYSGGDAGAFDVVAHNVLDYASRNLSSRVCF